MDNHGTLCCGWSIEVFVQRYRLLLEKIQEGTFESFKAISRCPLKWLNKELARYRFHCFEQKAKKLVILHTGLSYQNNITGLRYLRGIIVEVSLAAESILRSS